MGYFPGFDIDAPTDDELKEQKRMQISVASGYTDDYQVSGCCGRPVATDCIAGCVCPACGQQFQR